MSTTIRVSEATRARVAALAASTGRQMQVVVDEAVEAYERTTFWSAFEAGYEGLAADPALWSDVIRDRAGEEQSLPDSGR